MFKLKRCWEVVCLECYKHQDISESHGFDKIKLSRSDSYEYISEKFESLDYEVCENKLLVEEQKRYGLHFMFYLYTLKYFVVLIVGFLTGCIGAFVEVVVETLSCLKYRCLHEYASNNFERSTALYFLYLTFTVVLAAIGSLIVVTIEPRASGGGIAGVMGFLNGIRVPKVVKLKTLVVKMFSMTFAVVSGLAVGKEGPMVHIGTAIGGSLPMLHLPLGIRPFRYFHNDKHRRDFAAAGFAAGLTAAFGTPLAGMLMVLEEGISFWSADMTFRIFLCTLTSAFTLNFLISCYKGYEGQLSRDALLFLSVVQEKSTITYELVELPIFILMGIVGGLLGAAWIQIQKGLFIFRAKFIKSLPLKFLEVIIISALTATTGFWALTKIYNCSPLAGVGDTDCKPPPWSIKANCPEGSFHTTAIFYFQCGQPILYSLFSSHNGFIDFLPLGIFTIYYYFWSGITAGSKISAGLFVPNLVTGAAWGRMFAMALQYMNPETVSWAHPNKYAFMGSAAQLSGVTQLTFTIGVMMTEASGSTSFLLPIFLMLITTKWVGKIITESVFRTEIELSGVPILSRHAPPLGLDIYAKDIMNKGPLETLPAVARVGVIKGILLSSNHNGFPIVDSSSSSKDYGSTGRVQGLILKSQLNSIIKKKAFDIPQTAIEMRDALQLFRRDFASSQKIDERDTIDLPEGKTVDLSIYMNPNPYIVKMNASLNHTYKLFTGLGLRHLIVVNETNEAVGIITRKDLAVYRQSGHYCMVSIKKLNRRP